MPIPHYKLDDRNFNDLVNEMLKRIPGHTPEWSNPVIGDPGRTLIDLFAWLADTLLYRANLIPERQRLTFLRLLNIPMIPAQAAKGIINLEMANNKLTKAVTVPVHTSVDGPVDFETCSEINVLPVQGQMYIKRKPDRTELKSLRQVIIGLKSVYGLDTTDPYITTPIFVDNQIDEAGCDIISKSIDNCLWISILAAKKNTVSAIHDELGRDNNGSKILNIGVVPKLSMPDIFEKIGRKSVLKNFWNWELTSSKTNADGAPEYISLDVISDTTLGFTTQGLVRLELPDKSDIGIPENNVTTAGVGRRPPRIDDPKIVERLITWICLRPKKRINSLTLSWVGINAVEIDQRKTLTNVIIGTASGSIDLYVQLPGPYVDPASLKLQVEESGKGFIDWFLIDDLATASRDTRAYQLDPEAGTVRFGDGLRGKVPAAGMRIRIEQMRYGGGAKGNIAVGNVKNIAHRNLKVFQPIATHGGADGETLSDAEKRIPAFLKHGNRAVTAGDYKQLALETPSVELGRVEVLPKFKPQQYRKNVPGVVSVMVIPKSSARIPPNPRPDRITLERVNSYLDERRPVATEMYIIGVEYIQIGLTIAVDIRDGHAHDQVLKDVKSQIRDYLWPLAPGGNSQTGWQLGRYVLNQEIEVEVARVKGIRIVSAVNLFVRRKNRWRKVKADAKMLQVINLESWQLPELLSIVVVDDVKDLPKYPSEDPDPTEAIGKGTPIPVVPEVC